MGRQLTLLEDRNGDDWRLDERTKEAGRRGIAEARRALAEARRQAAAERRGSMNLLAWAIVGFVAAAIAGVVTGRPAQGCVTKIAVGVIGAMIGSALARAAGMEGLNGFHLRSILIAALGSSVLLFVVGAIESRNQPPKVPRRGPDRRSLP
jgi:uncharacterized membrane protein YeaQ/YmgE (transglycosylase-associated protein family)